MNKWNKYSVWVEVYNRLYDLVSRPQYDTTESMREALSTIGKSPIVNIDQNETEINDVFKESFIDSARYLYTISDDITKVKNSQYWKLNIWNYVCLYWEKHVTDSTSELSKKIDKLTLSFETMLENLREDHQ